jgi:hypothetical protein
MANTFITPSAVGKEALMILENELIATQLFHRGHTEVFTGAKRGDTITVKGPASFTAQEFTTTTTVQNATESSVSLVLEKHFDVSFDVTAKDWTLEISEFSTQLIEPAVVAIAQGVDNYIMSKVNEVPNYVGTAGDPPDALADIIAVNKKLNDLKIPKDGKRFAIVDSQAEADMLGITQVVNAEQRGDGGVALQRASMGQILGINWYMSQNVNSQGTASTDSTGWLVDNGSGHAAGSTQMDIDTGTNNIEVGDVFVVAGDTVQHVATAASSTSVTFSPALGSAVVDNAAITVVAGHEMNVAGHPNGLTVAIVPLELPRGAGNAAYIGDRNLGIRVVFDYTSSTKLDSISFDLLVGAKVQQGALLTRVLG